MNLVVNRFSPKKIWKKLRWGAVIIRTPRYVFKIFAPWPKAQTRKRLEWFGNRAALADETWSGYVNALRRVPFGFVSARGSAAPDNLYRSEFEDILWQRLEQQLVSGKSVNAHDLLSKESMNRLFKCTLVAEKLRRLMSAVDNLSLPAGSAHGDAHTGNAVYLIGGDLRLIDWSNYKSDSSSVYDLLHFYAMGVHREQKLNLAIVPSTKISGWNKLENRLEIPYNQLVALFILMKCSNMVEQNGNRVTKSVLNFLTKAHF